MQAIMFETYRNMPYGDNGRARVFISCGQRDDEEKEIASTIEQELIDLRFDPYVAIHIQSTRSLIGNILEALRDCEYYLFIDFRREQIIPANSKNGGLHEYRGSLFSNQELAIAAYLEKRIIAFQERGIIKRDGMLNAIQANVIPFNDRKSIVEQVLKKVRENWTSNWRNEISFYDKKDKQISPEYVHEYGESKLPVRFFHVTINNFHKDTSTKSNQY